MRILREMVPWLVVVGVAGALVAFLVARGHPAGRWGLAALLAAHGLVHLLFLVPPEAESRDGSPWPFDRGGSWLVRRGVPAKGVRGAGLGLLAVTVTGFLGTAGGTLWGTPFGPPWTAGLVTSALVSLGLLGLYFNPGLLLGVAIDLVLLGVGLWGTAPTA